MKKELIAVLLAGLTVSVFATDPSPTASADIYIVLIHDAGQAP
jgi:hypothetical protein